MFCARIEQWKFDFIESCYNAACYIQGWVMPLLLSPSAAQP